MHFTVREFPFRHCSWVLDVTAPSFSSSYPDQSPAELPAEDCWCGWTPVWKSQLWKLRRSSKTIQTKRNPTFDPQTTRWREERKKTIPARQKTCTVSNPLPGLATLLQRKHSVHMTSYVTSAASPATGCPFNERFSVIFFNCWFITISCPIA